MTTFDDRERAFENLFAHDQDLAFRAQARRNREIGHWAARKMGLAGDEADRYAADILAVSIEKGGSDALVTRLIDDLTRHGQAVSQHQVRRVMDELLAEAVQHVKAN